MPSAENTINRGAACSHPGATFQCPSFPFLHPFTPFPPQEKNSLLDDKPQTTHNQLLHLQQHGDATPAGTMNLSY